MANTESDLVPNQQMIDFGSLEALDLTKMIKILQKGGKVSYGV
jgi:hypothetical protein